MIKKKDEKILVKKSEIKKIFENIKKDTQTFGLNETEITRKYYSFTKTHLFFKNINFQDDLNLFPDINLQINFENCKFKNIEIFNKKIDTNIFFNNCEIKNLIIRESKINILNMSKINIEKFEIFQGSIINKINLIDFKKKNDKKNEIWIGGERTNKKNENDKKFFNEINYLNISNLKDCGFLRIDGNIFKKEIRISKNKIKFDKNNFNNIEILLIKENEFDKNFDRIRIGNTKFENFVISNLKNSKNSEINIGEIEAKNFKIENLRNYGNFKLYNLNMENNSEREEFNINNSSFGKSEFQNLNLNSFKKKNIMYLNNFQKTSFLDIYWPLKFISENKNSSKQIKEERENYRQLKQITSKQNDNISALKFYKLEYETYYNSIYIYTKLEKIYPNICCYLKNFKLNSIIYLFYFIYLFIFFLSIFFIIKKWHFFNFLLSILLGIFISLDCLFRLKIKEKNQFISKKLLRISKKNILILRFEKFSSDFGTN